MPRWRVRLIGEKFDLEEFPRFFTSPTFRVFEDEGNYFLEAESLEAFEGASDVHDEAIRLIRIINGVAKLQIGNFRNVDIGTIVEIKPDGASQVTVVVSADAIIGRTKLVATGDDPGAPMPGSQETDKWAALALSEQDVEKVLRIWANSPTTGSTSRMSWTSLGEQRFGRTIGQPVASLGGSFKARTILATR